MVRLLQHISTTGTADPIAQGEDHPAVVGHLEKRFVVVFGMVGHDGRVGIRPHDGGDESVCKVPEFSQPVGDDFAWGWDGAAPADGLREVDETKLVVPFAETCGGGISLSV